MRRLLSGSHGTRGHPPLGSPNLRVFFHQLWRGFLASLARLPGTSLFRGFVGFFDGVQAYRVHLLVLTPILFFDMARAQLFGKDFISWYTFPSAKGWATSRFFPPPFAFDGAFSPVAPLPQSF